MQICPHCKEATRQNKAGKTKAGSQRYRCMHCGKKYTPEPKEQGYPDEIRQQAMQMYVDGLGFRKIGRHLGIHHRTVAMWVKAQAALLPKPPMPEHVDTAEMDEMFTFIGDKKTRSTS
jgi:transposase-like protein